MRRRMAVLATVSLLALLLSPGSVAASQPALGEQPLGPCAAYELYMYNGPDFLGQEFHVCYGTSYYNLALYGWNDQTQSLQLAHAAVGQGVTFYWDINYGGASMRICGNTNRADLGSWDHKISSLKWTNACPR